MEPTSFEILMLAIMAIAGIVFTVWLIAHGDEDNSIESYPTYTSGAALDKLERNRGKY